MRLLEQRLKGEPSFVAKSPSTGAYARFREHEARVVRLLDGERTMAQIAAALAADGLAVSASAVEAFVNRLAALGFVERTLEERTSAQLERLRQERRQRRRRPLFRGELLRMRFPVGNPDALLTRTMPWVRWAFTPTFVTASLVAFVAYLAFMGVYWRDVTSSFAALVSPANMTVVTVVLFWMTFVGIGVVHELGHAYTCKHYTGEVHEMGMMILYFQPAFYCNVNDAWSFPDLRARMWVTVAGGWIELWLAAGGAVVWLLASPGTLVADVALLCTVLAGGLTVLRNANPLLPYDGYFALSDWLEIPNLRQRARAYLHWFLDTHLLGRLRKEPVVTPRERRIFLWYGALAMLYITLVYYLLATIVLAWVYRTFGAWTVAGLLSVLALRQRDRLRASYFHARRAISELHRGFVRPFLARHSPRWLVRGFTMLPPRWRGARAVAAVMALALLLPWPRTVSGRWTALPARHAVVTSPMRGVVTEVLVRTGDSVDAGTPMFRLLDRELETREAVQRQTRDSLVTLVRATRARLGDDQAVLAMREQGAESRYAATAMERRGSVVRASSDGVVLTEHAERWIGRAVQNGMPMLYIGSLDSLDVRIRLHGGGAMAARAGMTVSLLLDVDDARRMHARLLTVSPIAAQGNAGEVEATVRVPADAVWRAGMRGDAVVRVGRSTIAGALWWAVRTRLRPELLL
ncbi:MAG: HlyD family efflux transporter periplasmic adaptor subunit [Gemmatimonas sp.]